MVKPIEESWLDYRARVVPDDAGPVQLLETKNAFFAGALSFFVALVEADEPMAVMNAADGEMKAMAARLRREAGCR